MIVDVDKRSYRGLLRTTTRLGFFTSPTLIDCKLLILSIMNANSLKRILTGGAAASTVQRQGDVRDQRSGRESVTPSSPRESKGTRVAPYSPKLPPGLKRNLLAECGGLGRSVVNARHVSVTSRRPTT